MVRKLIRTILSTGESTKIKPGPLGFANTLPKRKITPRSYSRSILIQLRSRKTSTTSITTTGLKKGLGCILTSCFFHF